MFSSKFQAINFVFLNQEISATNNKEQLMELWWHTSDFKLRICQRF